MDTSAYDAGLPCKNPYCKSHGKPHPNCRCYAGGSRYATGGEVHCPGPHKKDCPLYMEKPYQIGTPEMDLSSLIAPSEEDKWAQGTEDRGDTVAPALLHLGASSLLGGNFGGTYQDPSSGMKGISNAKMKKALDQHKQMPIMSDKDMADKLTKKHSNKLASAVVQRMMKNGESNGFENVLSYISQSKQGHGHIKKAIDSLFGDKAYKLSRATKDDNDKVDKYLSLNQFEKDLTPEPQAYAEGGVVNGANHPMETALPDHNMMIQAAKARVNNYLNNQRPVKPQGLTFDTTHESPDKKRHYQSALSIANNPLGIMDSVKSGDLTNESLNHFKSMYPEGHNYLSKKMTERIIKAQLNGEKPPYKSRQAMSLFLGANLDSTFTPQSIMAAQATFGGKALPQASPDKKPKGSKSSPALSKVASVYMTPQEAADKRQITAK